MIILAGLCLVGSVEARGHSSASRKGRPAPARDSLAATPEPPDPVEITTDQIEMMAHAQLSDCNMNQIRDSLDVAWGFDDDRDGDGILDICDSDAGPDSLERGGWTTPVGSDSAFFQVRMRRAKEFIGVRVRFVPNHKGSVRLRVRNLEIHEESDAGPGRVFPAGVVDTVLVDEQNGTGPTEIFWNKKFHGRFVRSGFYEFTLAVGERVYRRRLAWI